MIVKGHYKLEVDKLEDVKIALIEALSILERTVRSNAEYIDALKETNQQIKDCIATLKKKTG